MTLRGRREPAVRLKALFVPNRADRPDYRAAPVEGHVNGSAAFARTNAGIRVPRHLPAEGRRTD